MDMTYIDGLESVDETSLVVRLHAEGWDHRADESLFHMLGFHGYNCLPRDPCPSAT